MTLLSSRQRNLLSDVVVQAREVAESACAQRVAALGIGLDKAPATILDTERDLRVGLRARARQLGSVEALVTEAGFEHWHRMLFARFLADNGLLVDDVAGQPVSIDEVAEYATEMGESDMWEVAARFASAMLPGIFRQNDPVLQMRLPVETRQELERLLSLLPSEIIVAEDSLGWVYQYWQTLRKKEVNKSERKIGGADLAPVTQLFTEDYMVRFLLENSLGAWWVGRHPDSPLASDWKYLRRHEGGTPAAGTFGEWPGTVAQVTVMDPCCGSGHFLVAAFGMLWRMRAEEEGLDAASAQDAVLRDNLFGLELDARCTQIAMFALALDAWRTAGYRSLPLPNVACSGIPAKAPWEEWAKLAGDDPLVSAALRRLHALFANADTLGSLIDPIRATEQAGLESLDWHQVAPLVQQALTAESKTTGDPAADVFGEAAAGIARAADYLSRRYTLVVTNPPFVGVQKTPDDLALHMVSNYPDSSQDLATVFLERCLRLVSSGSVGHVTPLGWLFLRYYKPMRHALVQLASWNLLAPLGKGAFGAISGEVVQVALVILSKETLTGETAFLDASGQEGPDGKQSHLSSGAIRLVPRERLVQSMDLLLALGAEQGSPLAERAESWQGLVTSDVARFIIKHWEVSSLGTVWERFLTAPGETSEFAGRESLLRWEGGQGALVKDSGAHNFNPPSVLSKRGVLVAQASLRTTLYLGEMFNDASSPVIPRNQEEVPALWAYLSSTDFGDNVRQINHKVIVGTGYLVKVPFDSNKWQQVAAEKYPDGLPEPWSDDPTQWLFRGDPLTSTQPLQVAIARLLGYSWPDQQPDALDALSDADGVVCLPAVGGEISAAERLRDLLSAAYGNGWSPAVLDELLTNVGAKPGAVGLEGWLRGGFFKDHCRVFANRPFIWQIWDGTPSGFSALVNYHRLDRKLLERLAYDYLGNWWIGRVRDEVKNDVPGAESRLKAAEDLKSKLVLILEGEPPYDIFARWKSLAEQPVGWEPDLDDGVRMNIRPFVGAGILRSKPSVKWDKERGSNPDGTGRINDLHRTLAEKREARGSSGV